MPHTMHVVSHTHWDREWYLTFQQFRMRLVDLVDNLLDLLDRDPEFRYFNLDAQTIVLEDYLAIKPQNRERLVAYIRSGRITIGPWYQLNDEFLTSGESTIRSLLIGHRIAKEFGACMKIGYLPDQFGNLSQMPQIFRGFGIDNAIVGRGRQISDDQKMEFLWESPDGSQVTASLMAFWYNNAQCFPADTEDALKYTENLRNRMSAKSAISHLLLMNGVDHLEVQQDLSPILAAVNKVLPENDRVVHSTLPQYIDALKQEVEEKNISLEKRIGELRDDRDGACLAGVLSTRMYLKQANHYSQILMEKYAEPLSSFAQLTGDFTYPFDILRYAWKLLMQNHPHDSICGCSVDQVHAEMMPRFQQVDQIAEELIARAANHIAGRVSLPEIPSNPENISAPQDIPLLVVFNTLNWKRTDPVRTKLEFPLSIATRGNPSRDDSRQVHGFKLLDENGEEIPFAVTEVSVNMKSVLSPVELPLDQWVQEYSIEFIAHNVPAAGYKSYRVQTERSMLQYESHNWGKSYSEIVIRLQDSGEVGDEYLHRPPLNDQIFTSQNSMLCDKIVSSNSVCQTTRYQYNMQIPRDSDSTTRNSELAECPIIVEQKYWRDSRRLDFKVEIENKARDHRLRMLFHSPIPNDSICNSDSAFDVINCQNDPNAELAGASSFHPQQLWTDISEKANSKNGSFAHGITVINSGLPEQEYLYKMNYPFGNEWLAVTLLRCVGYLSRRGDGPQFETPDAQCFGKHTFELSVYKHDGDWLEAKVWQQAHQFNTPLKAVQTTVKPGDNRTLPPSKSFVEVESDYLVVTAIKRAEDMPNRMIVRCFNISETDIESSTIKIPGSKSAFLLNLNEDIQSPLNLDNDGYAALENIRPKQILTVGFDL